MSFSARTIGLWLLIATMTTLIVIRYNDLIQFDPTQVIEPYGDGFKAYTVIQYHAQHDSTYSCFEGMNYPYGDHAVPGATQPLISNTLKLLSQLTGADLGVYTIPIVNWSMLISILLTSLFLYLIFTHQNLPIWLSISAAITITLLAPQIHRMVSHYGLTHPEVIPALLYFLVRFSETNQLKWSLAIMLLVFIYPLLHFYYFPITIFLISFYYLISFLEKLNLESLKNYALHYSIQVLIPLAFFVWWLILNDPIDVRSSRPWGFLYYTAKLEGTFLSITQPHFRWLNDGIINLSYMNIENRSYLGLVGIGTFLILLVGGTKNLFRRKNFFPSFQNSVHFTRLFWAALIIYIFSLGFPFFLPGFEQLIDYTGPIKQFRGIGRFAWIFYYVVNILGIILVYEWSQKQEKPLFKFLPLLCILILSFEAYHFNTARNFDTENIETLERGQRYTDTDIDFSRYQAILPIPYYNIGSGNFWWPYDYTLSMQQSLILSLQTGLPTTAAMLTRTSPLHALKQIQLILEPYRNPRILQDFPNQKPLLMLWDHTHKQREEYKAKYPHFDGVGRTILNHDNIRLAELSLSSFEERIQQRIQRIEKEIEQDSLYAINGFRSSSAKADFIYQSFDRQASQKPYLGKGGIQFVMHDRFSIFDEKITTLNPGENHEILLWMFIERDLNTRSDISFQEIDQEGNIVQSFTTLVWRTVEVMDDQGWAMLKIPFQPVSNENRLLLFLENKNLNNQTFYLDELLIKPTNTQLYKREENILWKNNRWF